MFGFHIKIAETASRLVITSPADTLMLLLFMVFTVWPLLIFLNQKPMPVRKVVVLAAITVAVYGFLIKSSRLTLDKTAQVASLEQFHWYHWTKQEVPLNHVANAYLATGNGTDRLVLQYEDGNTQSLSFQNQINGKPAAVLAINKFLGNQS